MTQPDEVSLRWAISSKKPFFVGSKSVDILSKRPLERQLVGFELGATSAQPKEGHLYPRWRYCWFGNLLRVLANLEQDHWPCPCSSRGCSARAMVIRTDDSVHAHARVAETPFYDPDNLRQAHERAPR